jgi:hypothetical protein
MNKLCPLFKSVDRSKSQILSIHPQSEHFVEVVIKFKSKEDERKRVLSVSVELDRTLYATTLVQKQRRLYFLAFFSTYHTAGPVHCILMVIHTLINM